MQDLEICHLRGPKLNELGRSSSYSPFLMHVMFWARTSGREGGVSMAFCDILK